MNIFSKSALLIVSLLASSAAFAAPTIDMVGERQGTISAGMPSVVDDASVQDFVQTAREAGSGMPTGKRMHKPMTFRAHWDLATNKGARTAMATGEMLDVVVHNADCSTGVCISVHLIDCKIIDVVNVPPSRGSAGKVNYHDITITYQKIEILE